MQVTIKLKGFLKIVIVLAAVIFCCSYFSYKVYRYILYKKIWHDIRIKQKKRLVFSYTFETNDAQQKGYLLLTPYALSEKSNDVIIMDLEGHIIVQKPIKGMATYFRQWNINGHLRYSYFLDDSDEFPVRRKVLLNGHFVILDSSLAEINEVHLLPCNDILPGKKQDLDGHDFILLSDGHYIVFSNYLKTVNNIPVCLSPAPVCKVSAPIIQEIKENKVIWQWDATHYPELYLNSNVNNCFYDTAAQDYVHLNSLIIDPRDSNLIASFPNLSQVVKINRHTGDIIWRLGGRNSDFQLTAQQVFLREHNVTLTDSNQTLLMFDNGDKNIRPYTRVLEYRLDEKNKVVTSFRSYNVPERFSSGQGSVQKDGDDYLICGGYTPYVIQVNSRNGKRKMKMTSNQFLYRTYLVKDITGINLSENNKK